MIEIYAIALKFIKFSAVGGSGAIIDFATTYLLKERCHTNKYIANSVGFAVSATTNYLLNRWWTFGSTSNNIPTQYLSFVAIAIGGLAINNLIIYFLTKRFNTNFYIAKAIAIFVVAIWNFILNYLITFASVG